MRVKESLEGPAPEDLSAEMILMSASVAVRLFPRAQAPWM